MSEKKQSKAFTIYKSPAIERVLETRPEASVSGRLSQVCERYRHIALASMPELTEDELQMIGNALSGTFIDSVTVDNLWADIEDERDDSEPDQPMPEYQALAERIKNMSVAERYAIIEKLKY